METKSKTVAVATTYAGLYVALVFILAPISYQQIQLRVADVLLGLIPLLGWSGIIGHGVGVMIANTPSPMGPIDMLNAIPSFIFSWLIWKLRKVSVFLGLTIYSIALGCSVGFTLNYVFGLPLLLTIVYVAMGIFLSSAVLGYMLYSTVKRLGILRNW